MQSPSGLGKHGEAVELFALIVVGDGEGLGVVPVVLGVGFDAAGGVILVHL